MPRPLLREDESLPRDSLTVAGCQSVFNDMASGHAERRSALNALLKRLGHWTTVISLTGWDARDPGGKLILHALSALAEFDQDLICERTLAELSATSSHIHTFLCALTGSRQVRPDYHRHNPDERTSAHRQIR